MVRSGFGKSWLARRSAAAGSAVTGRLGKVARLERVARIVQTFEVCETARVKAGVERGNRRFSGVSVLTFDSKSRRATSGPDRTPGCGWEEWQGLVDAPCKRGIGEGMIDGGVASDSGGIHRGAEKASSSGAGVPDLGGRVSLRMACSNGSWSSVQDRRGESRGGSGSETTGTSEAGFPPAYSAQDAGCVSGGDFSGALSGVSASGSGCSQP